MDAVASEYPDVVFYTYFLFSECSRALSNGAGRLVVLAGASGQQKLNVRAWFGDVLVVPLTQATAPAKDEGDHHRQ